MSQSPSRRALTVLLSLGFVSLSVGIVGCAGDSSTSRRTGRHIIQPTTTYGTHRDGSGTVDWQPTPTNPTDNTQPRTEPQTDPIPQPPSDETDPGVLQPADRAADDAVTAAPR